MFEFGLKIHTTSIGAAKKILALMKYVTWAFLISLLFFLLVMLYGVRRVLNYKHFNDCILLLVLIFYWLGIVFQAIAHHSSDSFLVFPGFSNICFALMICWFDSIDS